MLKQVQTVTTVRSKSTIGTKLLVQCGSCHKSFDQSYEICPHCGWKFGDPVPLQEIIDVDLTDENGNWFETYVIGSANGDKYSKNRGGSYGHDLIRFTINSNNPEHMKLFRLLDGLRDKDGCRYTMKLVG
jgi:hypothetical protein|tara:strand:+ start:94 stop:483 length:390 start_codon:yes stop_codon:yes gene_type:complete